MYFFINRFNDFYIYFKIRISFRQIKRSVMNDTDALKLLFLFVHHYIISYEHKTCTKYYCIFITICSIKILHAGEITIWLNLSIRVQFDLYKSLSCNLTEAPYYYCYYKIDMIVILRFMQVLCLKIYLQSWF